jgi:radical SAM protein with 4Fe4S-binding SPASM domain
VKPEDAEVNTKTGYKIVDEIYDFGAPWFGISGGEPLVREDILDIIEYAKATGFEVSLITSGFAFDEKRLNNLVRNEVHTAVSIDGTPESNDKIRGRGSYDKALFAMKKLSENGILDCIVTTMTKYNIKEIEHPAKLAAEYGARMVVQKNPTAFWDWFQNGFLGRCTIGGNYISVTENGDYRSCGFHEGYRLGNVKNKKLETTWDELQHSEFHLKLRDKSNIKGKCGVCEYREICGGCRTRAEYYTGDLFESDPACAYIPKVLREK